MVTLGFAFLRRRWGQGLLSIIVGTLGVAAVSTADIVFAALPPAAERLWGGADLIIGPKGSALDLVLCCALHVSDPRGLVSQRTAMTAASHPAIRAAAPIALGDNVQGWRIVGTTPALVDVYRARLAQGRLWTRPLEAVLGAQAARALHVKLGDQLVGAHGLAAGGEAHSQFPYSIVGILATTGSALDRLVLCDIQTVRLIHEHRDADGPDEQDSAASINLPDAATAVVASYRTPAAALMVPRLIDADPSLAAASPSFEIARLMSYLRPISTAALIAGLLLVSIAAITATTSLAAAMNLRTRDLALLRILGAAPLSLAAVALAEATMIAIAALVLGLILSAVLLYFGIATLDATTGLLITPHIEALDVLYVGASTLGLAALAALFPALRAARTSLEELLHA